MTNIVSLLRALTPKQILLVFIILGFLLYTNSLFNAFVRDDNALIVYNPAIRTLDSIPSFFTGSTFYSGGAAKAVGTYFRPLMLSLFTLLYQFSGSNPFWYHLVQIALHSFTAFLVYLLFQRFALPKMLALFLSLVFLVHPENSEAVNYISAIQDILYVTFGLAALLVSFRLTTTKQFLLLVLLLFLSLLSKESGMIFLPILAVSTYIFQKAKLKTHLAAGMLSAWLYLPLRINAIGLFTQAVPIAPLMTAYMTERLFNAPAIFFYYLQRFFFPKDLLISQSWIIKAATFTDFYLPVICLLGILGLLVIIGFGLYKKNRPEFSYFVFFFIVFGSSIFLHSNLFVPLDQTVAERWFYLPMVGLLGMLGVVINWSSSLKLKLFISVLLLLTVRTFIRNFDWKDIYTLASHDIKISRPTYTLESLLGTTLVNQNKIPEGIVHLEKSVALFPYIINLNNLGDAYERSGQWPKAQPTFRAAIARGQYYLPYENLAWSLLLHNDPGEVKHFAQESLRRFPGNAKLWMALALADYKLGNIQAALIEANSSYRLDHYNPSKLEIINSMHTGKPITITY